MVGRALRDGSNQLRLGIETGSDDWLSSVLSLCLPNQGAEDISSIKSGYQLGGAEQTYSWSQ